MDDPKPERDPNIADASLLFGGNEQESQPVPPASSDANHDEGYAIEDAGSEPETIAHPVPPIPSRPSSRAAKSVDLGAGENTKKSPKNKAPASSGVDQVWSRGAEWGGSLVRFGIGLIVAGYLLYATLNMSAPMLWLGVLLVCAAGLIVLAYPLLITLERPVRMTPEQALKDYFGAFNHLVPHTKRMWLLLAVDGRKSPSYQDFAEFNTYWQTLLNTWKSQLNGKGLLNPFDIELLEFKADKSAGQTEIDAKYSARVVLRGESTRVIANYSGTIRAVRGPDKMWYLDANPIA